MYKILFTTLLFFAFAMATYAGKNYTWNGSVDSSWTSNAANWTAAGGADPDPSTGDNADFIVDGTYADAPIIFSTPSGFDMDNLQVSNNSLMQVRGGTSSFAGSVAIRDGSDLIISGGTVNVAGDLYLFDGGSSIVVAGGNLDVAGDILLGNNFTEPDGTNGATSITINSGSVSCTNLAFDNTTGDTHSIDVSGGVLDLSGDLRSDGEDVILSISGSGIIRIDGNLTMTGGNDELTMTGGRLLLDGNYENSGSSSLSGGQVRLTGNLPQSITGVTNFNLLRVNNLLGVTLNDSISISNRLIFDDGIITATGHSVTFLDNAIAQDQDIDRFIDGPVNKIGNDAFSFPIGDVVLGVDFFAPIAISAPGSTLDFYRAEYIRANPDGLFPVANRETGVARVSRLEYWELDQVIGSSAETVTLSWNSNNSAVSELSSLTVSRWDDTDSEWKNEGNGGTTGTTSDGTVVSSGAISSFSPFTLGSTDLQNPLPVELITFTARAINSTVNINWTTSSEINNNHFIIEKTIDGKNIKEIARVDSKAEGGNSTEELNYFYADPIDFSGSAYYRLVQVDHDGTTKKYPFQAVTLSSRQIESSKTLVYPNPVLEDNFVLDLQSESEDIEFRLYDNNGRKVKFESLKIGKNSYQFTLKNVSSPGLHFLNILDPSENKIISTEKIILE